MILKNSFYDTSQIPIYGGYVKVRRVIVWVNTILNRIDIGTILLGWEGPCMVYKHEWYQKQNYCQIPIPYR